MPSRGGSRAMTLCFSDESVNRDGTRDVRACRTVLVVVRDAATGMWLADALSLLAADGRILTSFTVVPPADGMGADEVGPFLRARDCRVLPWPHAVRREFDLVLAADSHGLVRLKGTLLALAENADEMCYDRLLASIPFRAEYRRALGLSRDRKLVVVAPTWPCGRVAAGQFDLIERLLTALPPERYRVAAVVHPDVWRVHGGWQVRAWLAGLLDGGLLLLPSGEGWRAALVAANLLIGDHSPAMRHAAAIGLPVMLAVPGPRAVPADGVAELIYRRARPVRTDLPLLDQVEGAMRGDRSWQDGIAALMTSAPGRAGENLRAVMYRLLDLSEPTRPAPCPPVPLPCLGEEEVITTAATRSGDPSPGRG